MHNILLPFSLHFKILHKRTKKEGITKQRINKLVSIFIAICLMTAIGINDSMISVALADAPEQSETVKINNNVIDNSELNVRVVKQIDGEQTTIFKGKLKDYDNGAWIHMIFPIHSLQLFLSGTI